MAGGTELVQPSLWVGDAPPVMPTDSLDADSLGHYYEPAATSSLSTWAEKMGQFWKTREDLEMVFLGSSHGLFGIDPHAIKRWRSFNFGYVAAGLRGSQTLTENHVLTHCPKLKAVAMEVRLSFLWESGGDFTWNQEMRNSTGHIFDESHEYCKYGLPRGFTEQMAQAPIPAFYGVDSLGYKSFPAKGWGQALLTGTVNWGVDNANYQGNLALIQDLARRLAERQVHLLLIIYPSHPGYKLTDHSQTYGPSQETAMQIIGQLRELEKASPYLHLYDAHNFGNHDYGDDDAADLDHLSAQRAAKLTGRLDSLVNTLP